MMKIIKNRIQWLFFCQRRIATKKKGFSAHWTSFADEKSNFNEYTRLGKNTRVSNSTIGRCSYVVGAEIRNADIGSFCSIGREVLVGGLGKHPVKWLSTHPAFYSPLKQSGFSFVNESKFDELVRTKVGHDVWIGARAMILDGVKIGNGAIVAAGAVVTKDVAPYSIVGGVPAKEIRKRFDEPVIKELMELKWWNFELADLAKVSGQFIANENWSLEHIEYIKQKLEK